MKTKTTTLATGVIVHHRQEGEILVCSPYDNEIPTIATSKLRSMVSEIKQLIR